MSPLKARNHPQRVLLAKIETALIHLLDFPLAGPSREQLATGLRVAFQGKYAIYYAPNQAELVVVRVLHGARDSAAMAEYGAFSFV